VPEVRAMRACNYSPCSTLCTDATHPWCIVGKQEVIRAANREAIVSTGDKSRLCSKCQEGTAQISWFLRAPYQGGCPRLRAFRLLRNSKFLLHVALGRVSEPLMLWSRPSEILFRNSLAFRNLVNHGRRHEDAFQIHPPFPHRRVTSDLAAQIPNQ
jgi:hypothetical protein